MAEKVAFVCPNAVNRSHDSEESFGEYGSCSNLHQQAGSGSGPLVRSSAQ